MKYEYFVNLDERGSFRADVRKPSGETVFEIRAGNELECGDGNGCIERENDDGTGRAFWRNAISGKRYPMADRETGAKKRLAAILARRNNENLFAGADVSSYIQGDPRGAALYILRPGDVPAGQSADSYYSRGICVY